MSNPLLSEYQFWFGDASDNGMLFGINTNIDVVSAEGLENISVRSGSRQKARDDGSIPGIHLVRSKMPIFELEAIGDTAYNQMLSVFQAFRDTEGELHWKFPGHPQKFMRARVMERSDFKDGFIVGRVPSTVAFECADPRMYGVQNKTRTINQYSPPSESIDWDIDWDVDFIITASGGGDVVIHNAGNTDAYPLLRVFGPTSGSCNGVKLTNLTTGVVFEATTDILTNQLFRINMDARKRSPGDLIVSLDGASRYGDWVEPRETFYLQKGDNIIRFELTDASTSEDVQAVINWRDTYY